MATLAVMTAWPITGTFIKQDAFQLYPTDRVFVCFRWAQFFICPLMIEDAIDREVEAVDSGESSLIQMSALHNAFIHLSLWCCFSFLLFIFSSSSHRRWSEYQLARPSDSHRKEMLFGSLAKPGHPMSKFCWGENETENMGCSQHWEDYSVLEPFCCK